MKSNLIIVLVVLILGMNLTESFAQKVVYNPFGVLANAADDSRASTDIQIKVGRQLGVQYLRAHVILTDYNGTIPGYNAITAAGFKVILNVNYGQVKKSFGMKQPVAFPTDLPGYGAKLGKLLDKFKPALLVVENEETNENYHSGTAKQYIDELITAIKIAHARGIKVSNGALTTRAVVLLTYKDYYDRKMFTQAQDFAMRALGAEIAGDLPALSDHKKLLDKLNMAQELIKAYKEMNLDYVNFHWYEPSAQRVGGVKKNANAAGNIDIRALQEVVEYLQRATGKQVITNEIGQLNNSPALITAVLQKLYDLKLPFVIWYSGDGGEGKAVSLHNGQTAALKPNGIAFADFIKTHCR